MSTARAVMESYGDGGPRADDSADRGVSDARRPAEADADATTASHAVGRSETMTLAQPAVVAVDAFPSSLLAPVPSTSAASPTSPEPVDSARADVPSTPTRTVACVSGPRDDPTGSEPRFGFPLERARITAPVVGECRICLGTAAEGGGETCAPCACEGSVRLTHVACLERWCRETGAVSCELCTAAFPAHFATVGAPARASRRARERRSAEARATARERLARLLRNFAAAYGRPASGPADYAVINLHAVLEAEARARRRAERAWRARSETARSVPDVSETAFGPAETENRGGYASGSDGDDDGTRVTVIDARGRAVMLDLARVGAGRLARAMLEGEEALDARDDEAAETAAYDAYGSYLPGARAGRARRAGGLARGRAARARGDEGLDAASTGAFRIWLTAATATLCFFLALYLVFFAVAASSPASDTHVLSLRAFGLALPLLLLARVAYLYRRQSIGAAAARLDEVFVIRGFEATVDAEVGAPRVPGEEVTEEAETPIARWERDENEEATAGRRALAA